LSNTLLISCQSRDWQSRRAGLRSTCPSMLSNQISTSTSFRQVRSIFFVTSKLVVTLSSRLYRFTFSEVSLSSDIFHVFFSGVEENVLQSILLDFALRDSKHSQSICRARWKAVYRAAWTRGTNSRDKLRVDRSCPAIGRRTACRGATFRGELNGALHPRGGSWQCG